MSALVDPENIRVDDLTDRGRGQYFYHDKTSTLPIRDISGRGKTEPYIEYGHERGLNQEHVVGAENYCSECYQDYIQNFLTSDRRYLILMTKPRNPHMGRQIVGTMRKDDFLDHGGFQTVIGKTELYSFEDAIPAVELGKDGGRGGHKFSEEETEYVVQHFEGCDAVTEECVEEVIRLKKEYDQKQSTDSDSCSCGGC